MNQYQIDNGEQTLSKREMQDAILTFWATSGDDVLEATDASVLKLIEQMGDYLEVTTST